MASYLLSQFLERVGELPGELDRKYSDLRTLDQDVQSLLVEIDQGCNQLLQDLGKVTGPERMRRLRHLRSQFEDALDMSDRKIALAVDSYETVDKHIRDLDGDLSKMDANQALTEGAQAVAQKKEEMAIDPNEPRYCICNQVSFGEMIGCDNEDCPHEWFHYACVGLTEKPKGSKWYCPNCRGHMASKRRKK
ncbi:uncharacterized protein MONBRDRAFT_25212 [Monosiga brevicollis MX1]|uniref:Inhibitor of growth protein n=1 Tax=Monosiga brevicollis TaxID=81824 RepID=A9UYR1_MONBE|nr:uncharacterized protein MONBRDRAFT_25212 [Monosiga brevicollis MX1]EDQ89650.1 predicted protein [Monosiga brevicollis MX1]|eukprot:XP_001745679.1 hypothetical protein [Monosiga brevicollis MX1]